MQIEGYVDTKRDEGGHEIGINFGVVDVLVPVKPGLLDPELRQRLIDFGLPALKADATYGDGLEALIALFQKLVDAQKTKFREIGAHYVKIALHRRADWSLCLSYQTLFSGALRDYLGRAQASFGELQNLVWAHCVGVSSDIYSSSGAPGELDAGFAKILEISKIDNAESTMGYFANPEMRPQDYARVLERLAECQRIVDQQKHKLDRIQEIVPSLSEEDRAAIEAVL